MGDFTKFLVGDKVLHVRAKTLGVGTVVSFAKKSVEEHPVDGWWYEVDFGKGWVNEFAEKTLTFSVLDTMADRIG